MEKKEKLKHEINKFINVAIDKTNEEDKLDYLYIEISSHQGNLQMDYRLRDTKKVYWCINIGQLLNNIKKISNGIDREKVY